MVRSNSIDLNKRDLIYGINWSWMKITTLLLLIEISFSSSPHESVASLNLPSSSCFLILWAILISKMGLLDKRENYHSIDYRLLISFALHFLIEMMENKFTCLIFPVHCHQALRRLWGEDPMTTANSDQVRNMYEIAVRKRHCSY